MPGTAYVLFHHVMGETNGKRGVWSYVKGGMGGLTQALAKAAKDLGVEIRCDAGNVPSAAVARRLGFRLDRVEDDAVRAPAETGRAMIWALERDQPPAAG